MDPHRAEPIPLHDARVAYRRAGSFVQLSWCNLFYAPRYPVFTAASGRRASLCPASVARYIGHALCVRVKRVPIAKDLLQEYNKK